MPSVRSPRPCPPGRAALVAAVAAAAVAACSGRTLTLGDSAPRPYRFEVPQIVPELRSDLRTDNPTLTGDLLEIFFTTERGNGSGDVWHARRSSRSQPFVSPAAVAEVNTDLFETSAAISEDGLTLWFGSDRAGSVGSTDIWMSTRETRAAGWTAPENVFALNTAAEDIPRPPGQHGLVMPLSSKRGGAPVYQTFLAGRASPGAPFGPAAPVAELAYADRSTVDGFLTDDGLTLFFSSSPLQAPPLEAGAPADAGALPTADLFVAWRLSVNDPFGAPEPLGDLNTAADERDPWLTPDGRTLYFTSDRDGALNIYTASVRAR